MTSSTTTTRAQRLLLRYASDNLHDADAEPLGADLIRTSEGRVLAINLFGDVVENGRVVAEGNAGHDIYAPANQMPTAWKDV